MDWAATIVQAVIGGLITGGAAYAAIKVEIRWLRSDVTRIERTADSAHTRIDDVLKKVA